MKFILIFLLLVLVGCSEYKKFLRHFASNQDEISGLTFINESEPDTLDPALITAQPDIRIVSELFEGLLRFNKKGEVEPGVAASWEISRDQQHYIFHLRPEACWSDGKRVTAADFVASWRRALLPTTGAPYSDQFFALSGARELVTSGGSDFSKVGVEAADDVTLKVSLVHPMPYFLQLVALPIFFPVRTDLVDRFGDDWVKPGKIISNGAYVLSEWKINDAIVMKRNPFYWDAQHVALSRITALPIAVPSIAYNFYAARQVDLIMGHVPPALLEDLKKKNDFHTAPFFGTVFVRFNCSKTPFQDARVRKAFALVIDRERISKKIMRAGEQPAESFVPPGVPQYYSPKGIGYDSDRARRLLAEAGYPGGKGFPLVNYLHTDGGVSEAIAVELQSMWQKELGVSVLLERQEWKVFLASMNNLDFYMVSSNWIGDYLDPNSFLEIFKSKSANNRTGWNSPEYDQLLETAAIATNKACRSSILGSAEQLLIQNDLPIVPLFFNQGIQLYDPTQLGGIEGNLLDKHPFREMYKMPLP